MSRETVESVRGSPIAVSPLNQRALQRRSLDYHLWVRVPALYRLLIAALAKLPTQSRVRRRMLARGVRLAYAAGNRRDFDVVLLGLDPAIEYRPSGDLMPPDLETVFYGHDGYLRLWRYWLDAFADIGWQPEVILDFGDSFLVTTQQRGRGSGSGVPVSEPVFQLFKLRRGLVVRQDDFLDRSKALEAAGFQR
jgi:hypothetical protein